MEKWLNHTFETSSTKTPEFKEFSREFIKTIKKKLGSDFQVETSVGHFYVSGFIVKGGRHIYFSISDVRFFKNEWHNHILIRTAKDNKDYSGGQNHYTKLENIRESIERLIERS